MQYKLFDRNTIQYSPYAALIAYPTLAWHKVDFFKIMYVINSRIEIRIKSRLSMKRWQRSSHSATL